MQVDEHLTKISNDISALSGQVAAKKKDGWDRLSALSPFVGGVLVAGVGLYFTITSQERQIAINEVDLAVKFFPYITAKDSETRAQAFSVIQAVGGALLISKLAPIGGKSVEQALIAAQSQSNDPATKQTAQKALERVDAVAALQTQFGLPADGIVGPKTMKVISDFQASNGLTPTGNLDSQTIAKIDMPTRRTINTAQ